MKRDCLLDCLADSKLFARCEVTSPEGSVPFSAENLRKAAGDDFRTSEQSESGNEHSSARCFYNVAEQFERSRYKHQKADRRLPAL